MFSFDPTLTLGAVLNIAAFLVGGSMFAATVRGDVRALSFRVTMLEKLVEKMQMVLDRVAVQDERLNSHARRIEGIEARLFGHFPMDKAKGD